ncbi:NAD-dependent epimerase/dehydratase [Desulfonatronospira thiodismutans ASO3-1]|uniref:NAD-dependent epimerase/dehydratase n=1 Tax=Desulfonatronospira thiodismutans ASO3-1 TaxID=555779 RepID=D6SN88_9BACT|nr:NAD(P)-dependent oxidoreductase [Desulfonatronospira thiodismutans]EFI34214.1 NAD-dependent epimerase/dehydratase [Desulfonatronospira thiodismutans ASO3-1]
MHFTVLGASGFIGRALLAGIRGQGYQVLAPGREEISRWPDALRDMDLGHVIYCIGVTADFRTRPLDAVEAHVCVLKRLLKSGRFTSLTYLSSVRVYAYAGSTREDSELWVRPDSLDALYNLSKLMGESACLQGSKRARVVRLSHVYGFDPASPDFLSSVLQDAARTGKVTFRTSPDSAKDYISLKDVVELLPLIARDGQYGIYNLACGMNLSNQELADMLRDQGIEVEFASRVARWTFPRIDISRLKSQFYSPGRTLARDLPGLLNEYRRFYEG